MAHKFLLLFLPLLAEGQFRAPGGRPQRPLKTQPLPELVRPERQPPANRPPLLQEGHDLVGFQINEDTPVGSVVYTLQVFMFNLLTSFLKVP